MDSSFQAESRIRKNGKRKEIVQPKGSKRNHIGSSDADVPSFFSTLSGSQNEHKVNSNQMLSLEHMYESNPVVQAARTFISGQLLSGGISLKKDGVMVDIENQFRDHLNTVWIKFAQDVIDSFLKFGFVVVAYDQQKDSVLSSNRNRKKSRPPDAKQQPQQPRRAALRPNQQQEIKKEVVEEDELPRNIVPLVPSTGSYEVSYSQTGARGYVREYYVYSTNALDRCMEHDEDARVIIYRDPDIAGNVKSPLASVFNMATFVSTLTELALMAETARARPRVTTQIRKKDESVLTPAQLFIDPGTQASGAAQEAEDNANNARMLHMQQQMCQMINTIQTSSTPLGGMFHRPDAGPDMGSYVPPDVTPSMFTLPKDHEMAPHTTSAEARGDLEPLIRLSVEQFCAAFGIPSDLVFSGKFVSNSNTQLALLNTTILQLSKAVNEVLTMCYRDIYAETEWSDIGTLQLLTSPISSTNDVIHSYQAGLIPIHLAMPFILHSMGSTKDEIDNAVAEAKEREKEKMDNERELLKRQDRRRDLRSPSSSPEREREEEEEKEEETVVKNNKKKKIK